MSNRPATQSPCPDLDHEYFIYSDGNDTNVNGYIEICEEKKCTYDVKIYPSFFYDCICKDIVKIMKNGFYRSSHS